MISNCFNFPYLYNHSLVVVVIKIGVVVDGLFGSFGTLESHVTSSDTVHHVNSMSNHKLSAHVLGIGVPLKQTKYAEQSFGLGRKTGLKSSSSAGQA